MKLSLYRSIPTLQSTPGQLFLEGNRVAYTLELPIRDGLPGSAIPAGEYPIQLEPSPDFQARAALDSFWKPYCDAMPHVICPPRSFIMLHPGNYPTETQGCILVGESQGINAIGGSRMAFYKLYSLIQAVIPDVSIQIFNPPADPPDSAWPNS